MVTALPSSPRAVPPTYGQISPPDLLHHTRTAGSQPVWWQCLAGKHVSPK